jgi:hypothetical protein
LQIPVPGVQVPIAARPADPRNHSLLANAPGGCSCNLDDIFVNATGSLQAENSCSSFTAASQTDLLTCQCCAYSAAVSAFYSICPNTDPTNLSELSLVATVQQFEAITGSCSPLLQSANCLANYGIGSADSGKYLDPDNLPAAGTRRSPPQRVTVNSRVRQLERR